MADPGWYPQSGGHGYWDGQQWVRFEPAPGMPKWMLITWTVMMCLFVLEGTLTWQALICSLAFCTDGPGLIIWGLMLVGLAVIGLLLRWALREPTASRKVTAAVLMAVTPLVVFALPMVVGPLLGSS